MGAPSDILGLGEFRRVEVDGSLTLSLPAGSSQYKLAASANRVVDIINRTARDGQIIMLCGPDSNRVDVNDDDASTNISLANGVTTRALSQYDTLILRYENDTWIEVAFTNAV